jgi:hypothetical protein
MIGSIVILVETRVHVVCRCCHLYRIPPDPRDLATYIKGLGGDGVGQIESKPGSTPMFTFIATLFD